MGTVIWLLVATVIGTAIGYFGFDHMWVGALIGFVAGGIVRLGVSDACKGLADAFDTIDTFD